MRGLRRVGWVVWAVVETAAAPPADRAGESLSTITVTAVGRVSVVPVALQFSFPIEVGGADLVLCAQALDKRREAAALALKGIGVAEKDLRADFPHVRRDDDRQRMERMMRRIQEEAGNEGEAQDDEKKGAVWIRQTLTARLPLVQKEGTPLMLEIERVKEKVKGIHRVDTGHLPPDLLTGGPPGSEDGFRFQLYAPLDPKEQQEGAARAMAGARRLAEPTARALGKSLGELMAFEVQRPDLAESDALLGDSPEALELRVIARVTYALK